MIKILYILAINLLLIILHMEINTCCICGLSDKDIIKPCDCADTNGYEYYMHRHCLATHLYKIDKQLSCCEICDCIRFTQSYGHTNQCNDIQCKTLKYFVKLIILCCIISFVYCYLSYFSYIIYPWLIFVTCIFIDIIIIILYMCITITLNITYVNIKRRTVFCPIIHVVNMNINLRSIYNRLSRNKIVQSYRKYNPNANSICYNDTLTDSGTIFAELSSVYKKYKLITILASIVLLPVLVIYCIIKSCLLSYTKYWLLVITKNELANNIILNQNDPNQYMLYP